MTDSVTPAASTAPSAEYEDEDYDVVNAERIDGVEEDDDDTADEDADVEDTPFEEEEDEDVCFALDLPMLAIGLRRCNSMCATTNFRIQSSTFVKFGCVGWIGSCKERAGEI
jgi:hypothetical protein